MRAARHRPRDDDSLVPSLVAGLRAFVARRVPAQDADDVTQDVLLRLHQNVAALRDAEHAQAWVYGIARRAIADFYRRRPPTETLSAPEAETIPAPDQLPRTGFASFAGAHSVDDEVLSWLRPMAEALPDGYREALLMADFEGRKQRQVADALGLSLSGAKSRVQRARALLGERLRQCCEVALGADGKVVDFKRNACDC